MGTEVSFDQALEHCLQELARTGKVEASLGRYPQYAGQLRPLLGMAQTTRRYYETVPAAPGGLATGRERFLAVAAQQRAQQRSRRASAVARQTPETALRRRTGRLALPIRLIALVLVLVMGAAVLGGGIVWAAGDSLPGDLLYPVKLTTEDVRLAFASDPAAQVELALGFVEERAGEMQALAAAGAGIPDRTVVRMERQVERALAQTALAEDEKMSGLLKQVAARTSIQAQRLAGLHASAPQQAQAGLERAATALRRSARAAEEGLNDPATFRWHYRQRAGEPEITPEPEQREEQHQHRNREEEGRIESTPVQTPSVTPHGPRANGTPQATRDGLRVTATPTASRHGPATSATPEASQATAGPKDTPQHAPATATPQTTPRGPHATDTLQPTSAGPRATDTLQSTPKDPPTTPGHPHETPKPQPPGGGPDGGH